MNRFREIPTGFLLAAQGCSNPGHRDEMKPQPRWGCAEIEFPREPGVARTSQPRAEICNPYGIRKKWSWAFLDIPLEFP